MSNPFQKSITKIEYDIIHNPSLNNKTKTLATQITKSLEANIPNVKELLEAMWELVRIAPKQVSILIMISIMEEGGANSRMIRMAHIVDKTSKDPNPENDVYCIFYVMVAMRSNASLHLSMFGKYCLIGYRNGSDMSFEKMIYDRYKNIKSTWTLGRPHGFVR
jgi:hypothetical protein